MPLAAALFCGACTSSGITANFDSQAVEEQVPVLYAPPRIQPYVVHVDAPMATLSPALDRKKIRIAANLVADWQIRHMDKFDQSKLVNFQGHRRFSFGGWLMGTMAIGMTRWGLIDGNEVYLNFIRERARKFGWGVEQRVFDADDYMIGQAYLELYEGDKNAAYLALLRERLDHIYENWPTVNNHSFGESCVAMSRECRERWTWIDALFMGAPVWIGLAEVTGDKRYLEFGDHEFWASFDSFWDADDSLLYRDIRYISLRDRDGHKIFWSRGNGWTYASFARILPKLPKNHPNRAKYIARFRAMAVRLAELQRADGGWSSSLTNPELSDTPETSGSAFFVYGTAWGINNGLLDAKKYRSVVERGWAGLTGNIYADGRLAYVQPSGSAPAVVHKESTDVYGVGAFLLAASEVYQLAGPQSR